MKTADLLLGGAAAVLGAAAYIFTLSFPRMADGAPGPSLFPQILAVLLIGFGSVVMFQARHKGAGEGEGFGTIAIVKAGLVLVGIAFYVVAVTRLGFIITGSALLIAMMTMMEVRPRVSVPASILVVVFTALLFGKVLRVPLPNGLFGFETLGL